MKTEISLEQLLRWRLSQAEAEALPAPKAARLLEMARPWWEAFPETLSALLDRLMRVQVAYGHAMADPGRARGGHPVPAVILGADGERDASARVLYLAIREGRLRMRFKLDRGFSEHEAEFEATFLSGTHSRPFFSAQALLSVDGEYRVDAQIAEEVAETWASLKVTDPMPFRLILRTGSTPG